MSNQIKSYLVPCIVIFTILIVHSCQMGNMVISEELIKDTAIIKEMRCTSPVMNKCYIDSNGNEVHHYDNSTNSREHFDGHKIVIEYQGRTYKETSISLYNKYKGKDTIPVSVLKSTYESGKISYEITKIGD